MALRLRGATSGYIELKAPASAGDNTLTLPTNNGSANQLLKTDGSGNLSWVDDNSGVSLSGSTNNTIATVTGANALAGEANLTFDGTTLKVAGGSNTTQAVFSGTGGSGARGLEIVTESVGAADEGVIFNARASGTTGRLTFKTNSATAMTILGNGGNIGIGTTSPDQILECSQSTGTTLIKAAVAGNSRVGFEIEKTGATTQTWRIQDGQSNNGLLEIYDQTDSRSVMVFDGSGKVGIGTIAPTKLLHLSGGSSPALKINASDATPGIFMADSDRTSQDQHLGEFQALWNGNLAGRIVVVAGPDTTNKDDGHMDFYTSNGGSNGNRMRIKHDGKIGIGTTAPPDKLNVVGAVRINQSSALDHLCNAGTMLEVRGDAIGSGVTDYDFFKGFKIALNDGTEYGGQAQFAVGRWQENGTNARSSLMISLGHGAQSSVSNADTDILLLTSDGQVEIEDGNLKIGTAGHGIDFSATADGPSQGNETLDDYERGTYSPQGLAWNGSAWVNVTFDSISRYGRYTKIGGLVHVQGFLSAFHVNSSHDNQLAGISLPFNAISTGNYYSVGVTSHSNGFADAGYTTFFVNPNTPNMYSNRENTTQYNTWSGSDNRYIMFQASYMCE